MWVSTEPNPSLTAGALDMLIEGLDDDVSLDWALIRLGILQDVRLPPTQQQIADAFATFDVLIAAGLISLGRVEYVDATTPPNSVAPVRHVPEPAAIVRERVEHACSTATRHDEWAYSCWVVTSDAGDTVARETLASRA